MHIGSVNNQINFGQIVKIKSVTNPSRPIENGQIDKHTNDVISVLNNKRQATYKYYEIADIKDFFIRNIQDYSGSNEVIAKKINGDTFLFTGKDVNSAKMAEGLIKDNSNRINKDKNIPKVLKPVYKKLMEDEINYTLCKPYHSSCKTIVLESSEVDISKLTAAQFAGEKPINGVIDKFFCFEKTSLKDKLII